MQNFFSDHIFTIMQFCFTSGKSNFLVFSFRNVKTVVVYKKFKMACHNIAIVQLSNIILSNCLNVTFVQGFMAEHMTVCGGHLTAGETASQIFSHAKVSGAIHRGGWDQGGRSCAGARVAPAEKFRLGRKF